jgi:hypothetical protein
VDPATLETVSLISTWLLYLYWRLAWVSTLAHLTAPGVSILVVIQSSMACCLNSVVAIDMLSQF